MKNARQLDEILTRIDGRGYKAYKELKGSYRFDDYTLTFDTIQPDPFANPSRVRITLPQKIAGFPEDTFLNRSRKVALVDFITRELYKASTSLSKKGGSGSSGLITTAKPGQEILERSSVVITPKFVEARILVGLPALGRRINSDRAREIFFRDIPTLVKKTLHFNNLNRQKLYKHITVSEDADYIRNNLSVRGLVAFVANGSHLPRISGVDPRPLERPVEFQSPPSLLVEFSLPNHGTIKGMGIPKGVTLIVGGGFHGKSTLLDAIKLGIYNHIPGDGREFVVSLPETVMIRAEDGRRVEGVDISPFINNLPYGKSTSFFQTENASGSTSQAANIMEALEVGAGLLLIDEDTSATNFMIRDHRMQELISKENEPITPFIDKVRQMYKDLGVSSIIVIGGSGDYFDVADRVICMKDYRATDCTDSAKQIALKYRKERKHEGGETFGIITRRAPIKGSLDPSRGRRDVKVSPKGLFSILFGRELIDLSALEQIVSIDQTRAVSDALVYAMRYMDGKRDIREVTLLVLG
ncbi:MAG: ATPase, partial [Nitrospirae bacterium]